MTPKEAIDNIRAAAHLLATLYPEQAGRIIREAAVGVNAGLFEAEERGALDGLHEGAGDEIEELLDRVQDLGSEIDGVMEGDVDTAPSALVPVRIVCRNTFGFGPQEL